MSTTFGVKIPQTEEIVEIAFRTNNDYIMWTNEVASLLNDDIEVIALDNGNQGIETIGDIKNKMNKQNNN